MITEEQLWGAIPGGSELVKWFGRVPDFHDAEIVQLALDRKGESTLTLHWWRLHKAQEYRSALVPEGNVVVTFFLQGILDLKLECFSPQNVISELAISRAPDRPDRTPSYPAKPSPNDYELRLGGCYGLYGTMRVQNMRIEFAPGSPPR